MFGIHCYSSTVCQGVKTAPWRHQQNNLHHFLQQIRAYLLSCLFLGPHCRNLPQEPPPMSQYIPPRLSYARWAWGREVPPLDCCVAPLPWRPQPPRRTTWQRRTTSSRSVFNLSRARSLPRCSLDVASSPCFHALVCSLLPATNQFNITTDLTSSLFSEPLQLVSHIGGI